MRVRTMLGALEERPFRLLWFGQATSSLGDALIPVALAFAVLGLRGSARDLGVVLATYTIAQVAFLLVGGVWADRLSRRLVMLACDALRAGAQLVIGAAVIAGVEELWQFVAIAFVMGSCAAFFRPASTGLIPQTISAGRLQQANALISLSRSSITIFGPAMSGVLVVAVGPGWVFAVNGLTYVVSAAFLFLLRTPVVGRPAQQTFARDLAEGWREVRSRSWVSAGLACFALSNVGIATYFVLGPLVAEQELGGAAAWGVALTGGAIGGVLGGMIALRFQPLFPLRWSFGIGLFFSLPLLALIVPVPVGLLAVAGGLSVFAIELGNALWNTTLQERIPERSLSRVSAYDWMVSLVFMPVGYAAAGPLASTIGLDATLALAAGLSVAANLGTAALPSVRNLRRLAPPLEEKKAPAPVAA